MTEEELEYLTYERIKELRELFDEHGIKKIDFALRISKQRQFNMYSNEGYFIVQPGSKYSHPLTFKEALQFIEERDGIYYAINNKGERHWDFVDKPTKKQAQYQRNKHGNRIVFKSFSDWKEYLVREDELD